MSFAFLIVYIVFTFLRPGELVPALAEWQIMDVVSILALLTAGLGLLAGRGLSFHAPQILILVAFFAWAAFTILVNGDGSGSAFEDLLGFAKSSGVAFTLLILNVDSMRRVRIVAIVLAIMTFQTVRICASPGGFMRERQVARSWVRALSEVGVGPEVARGSGRCSSP